MSPIASVTGTSLQWGRAFLRGDWRCARPSEKIPLYALQWGRAFLRAETSHLGFEAPVTNDASMGPRVFARGDGGKLTKKIGWETLQWGRAFLRAETTR